MASLEARRNSATGVAGSIGMPMAEAAHPSDHMPALCDIIFNCRTNPVRARSSTTVETALIKGEDHHCVLFQGLSLRRGGGGSEMWR